MFFCLIAGSSVLFSQTPLVTGQINKYARVTAVTANSVTIPLADLPNYAVSDTVMVMQMSGAIINADYGWQSSDFLYTGSLQNYIGSPGYYEVLIIAAINAGTGEITFSRNLIKPYSALGKVQLIKIRSFRNAVVNSDLTCATWDSTSVTGGVLAFFVKGLLTLNANINVSDRGFKGGIVSPGSGHCINELGSADSVKWYFYKRTSTVSGYKGEGVGMMNEDNVKIYPNLSKGRGPSLTGGGGGNGHYSGGGGGSNYGAGNTGHVEVSGCGAIGEYPGGIGGFEIKSLAISGGVFLGGGGGASTYGGAVSASNGGNGGGIVIILADSIAGNGRIISANGAQPVNNTVTNSGAGGGGGAGAVIISTRHYSSNPVLNAIGGHGGNTTNSQGAGGGGGGGLIWTKGVFGGTKSVAGGVGGINGASPSNLDGAAGTIVSTLKLPLNGFLFNEIYSSETHNRTDSICEGEIPPMILGTLPEGGSGTYTYQWQRSINNSTWDDVAGSDINYTPSSAEIITCWFRRVVDDGLGITDISMPVQIIVHPIITMNVIGTDTTLCYNQDPEELYPLNAPAGGTGLYFYTWEKSNNGTVWTSADGTHNQSIYDPQSLTVTQHYHRIINSGACVNTSAPVVVTILPSISANSVSSDQTICQGMTFANLTGTAPSGGAGSGYTYLWKSSTDNTVWSPASGVNNGIGYDPLNDAPGNYYYKRIVFSGMNNTCQDTSASVFLKSHPSITGNTISADQTICEGSAPAIIDGLVPGGGAGLGSFTYQWKNSTNGTLFTDMPGVTTEDLTGTPLTADTWYQRVAYSSVCTSTSGNVKVTVDPAITNYQLQLAAGGHDTICTGQTPALIQGAPGGGLGAYTYKWESSTDNIIFTDLSHSDQTYQPGTLAVTTWFRRTVTSGTCDETSVFKITVLPVISGNTISANQAVCNNKQPALLNGVAPTGGDGKYRYLWEMKEEIAGSWTQATGGNNTVNYQPPVLQGNTQFRRNVYSGENNCCASLSDVVSISVDTLPSDVTAGPDITLFPYQFAMNLQGGFEGSGTSLWSVGPTEGDPIFADPADPNSAVVQLGTGDNHFIITVSNGVCDDQTDEVIVTVPEIHIPEGISPNNDLLNDYFKVDGLEFTENELVIINTGGAVVYREKNYRSDIPGNAWYGLDNQGNELPEGTYYFLLTIKGALDSAVPDYEAHLSGFILIRR